MMELLGQWFRDEYVFPLFQAAFLGVVLWAWFRDRGWFRPKTGSSATVKRGEKSWGYFHVAYGVLAVVFVEVNSTTEAWKHYKTVVSLADLALLFYLCFFNGWFRNKLMGLVVTSQQMEEP